MCQLNLDVYQGDMNDHFDTDFHMPCLYFTQLMGLAFGHSPEELGIGKEFVDARDALAKIGVEVPVAEDRPKRKPRKRKDDKSLPMPRMGEEEG
jgi:heterodisulfide reductase subunit B